jgi:hypothetical protein
MQNKPNFRKSQMNLNFYSTMDYEKKSDWTIGENKPNSNPIKANSPAPLVKVLYTLRRPAPKLRRLLITLFGSGYAGLGHSGTVYLQCTYSCIDKILEKNRKI